MNPSEQITRKAPRERRRAFTRRPGFPTRALVNFLHADTGPDEGQRADEHGDRKAVAVAFLDNAIAYNDLGEPQQALEFSNRALSIFKEIDNRNGKTHALFHIGVVYDKLQEWQRALEAFNQVLSIFQDMKVGGRPGEAITFLHIGMVYFGWRKWQQALEFSNRALSISEELGDRAGEATALYNIGQTYFNLGDLPQALKFFNKALRIFRELRDRVGVAYTLNELGLTRCCLEETQRGVRFLSQAVQVFHEVGDQAGVDFALKIIKAVDTRSLDPLLSDDNMELGREPMPDVEDDAKRKRAKGELTARTRQKNREGTQLVAAHLKKPLASAFKKAAKKQNMTTQEALEKLVTKFVKATASPAARKKLLKTTIKNQKAALQAALKTALDLV